MTYYYHAHLNKAIKEYPPNKPTSPINLTTTMSNKSNPQLPPVEIITKPHWSYAFIRIRPSTTHYFYDIETSAVPEHEIPIAGPSRAATNASHTTTNKMVAVYYPHPKLPKDYPPALRRILKEKIEIDPWEYDLDRIFLYQEYESVGKSRIKGVAILKREPKSAQFTRHLHPRFKGELFYEGRFREEFAWPVGGYLRSSRRQSREAVPNGERSKVKKENVNYVAVATNVRSWLAGKENGKENRRPETAPGKANSSSTAIKRMQESEAREEAARELARARKGKMKEQIVDGSSNAQPTTTESYIEKQTSDQDLRHKSVESLESVEPHNLYNEKMDVEAGPSTKAVSREPFDEKKSRGVELERKRKCLIL